VNVLPKKRTAYHFVRNLTLRILYVSMINYQLIWYSASLLMYGWFTGWIAYEIFVWNKPITQVNPTNFVGAIAAMALIWAGTFLFKMPRVTVFKRFRITKTFKLEVPKMWKRKLLRLPSSTQPLPAESTPAQLEPQSHLEQQTVPELSEQPVPNVCLTCKELIQCIADGKE
jgi:hypothetical protein